MKKLRVFLSYPYRELTESVVAQYAEFLRSNNAEIVDGKNPDPTGVLEDEIVASIRSSNLLLVFVWKDIESHWVLGEIGVARGNDIPFAIVTDSPSEYTGLGDKQHLIDLTKGELYVAGKLSQTLDSARRTAKIPQSPPEFTPAPKDEIEEEDWPEATKALIYKLREIFDSQNDDRFEQAASFAERASSIDEKCWRFPVARSSALVQLNDLESAERVLKSMAEQFSDHRRALAHYYTNIGWIKGLKNYPGDPKSWADELADFRHAIKSEPRPTAYCDAIAVLIKLERLTDAESMLLEFLVQFPEFLELLKSKLESENLADQIGESKIFEQILNIKTK